MRVNTFYIIYKRSQENFRNNADCHLLQEQAILPYIIFNDLKYAYLDIFGFSFSNKNGQVFLQPGN